MWFDEVERIGKQRCTPIGYVLQQVGEIVGFIGLLTFFVAPAYLGFPGLIVPIVLGILGTIMVSYSWSLASRKQFVYDYERRESSWIEAGEKRTYTFNDWKATNGQVRG